MYKLNDLIGIPFENGARQLDKCDCMGLAVMAHKCYNIDIPDFKIDAFSDPDISGTFIEQLESNNWVKLEKPEAPCIVCMAMTSEYPDLVTHIGTYIGNDRILHTLKGKTSYTFKLDHPFFKNKILGFYKYGKD